MIEQIKKNIILGQKILTERSVIPRDCPEIDDFLRLHKIVSLLGGRRVGKTHLMIQYVQTLLKKGDIGFEQLVFLDFAEKENHAVVLKDVYEYYEKQGIHPFFVLDEIQELPHFEEQLIPLYNLGATCLITGSNSKLLGQDISTKLRGRTVEIFVEPLNFNEFQRFKHTFSPQKDINALFLEFLHRGGYPEVVLTDTESSKKSLLRSYLEVMIYRDVIERYSLRNEDIIRLLISYFIMSAGKEININKFYNSLKSKGYAVSKNTIYEYVSYLKNVFFVGFMTNFYKKTYFEKAFLLDNGYLSLEEYASSVGIGQKFEQLVYRHLKQQGKKIGFVKEPDIDFTDGETNRQACFELHDENFSREVVFAKSKQKNVLVTFYQGGYTVPGVELQHVFKFLQKNDRRTTEDKSEDWAED